MVIVFSGICFSLLDRSWEVPLHFLLLYILVYGIPNTDLWNTEYRIHMCCPHWNTDLWMISKNSGNNSGWNEDLQQSTSTAKVLTNRRYQIDQEDFREFQTDPKCSHEHILELNTRICINNSGVNRGQGHCWGDSSEQIKCCPCWSKNHLRA